MAVRARVRAWAWRKLTAQLVDRDMVIPLENGWEGRADVGSFRGRGPIARSWMLTVGLLMLLISGPVALLVVVGLLVEGAGWAEGLAVSFFGGVSLWVFVVQQAAVRWMIRNFRTPRLPQPTQWVAARD